MSKTENLNNINYYSDLKTFSENAFQAIEMLLQLKKMYLKSWFMSISIL